MEMLALILFYISLIGSLVSIGLIIYNVVKKELKYKKKKLLLTLVTFIVLFIGSTIFYGAVQSPESKARYEASEKAKAEEKAEKELAGKEEKAEEEKQEDEKSKEQAETKTESEVKQEVPVKEEVKKEVPKDDDRFIITSKPNTTDAVNELYYKAKEKAATATEGDLKEAIKFINDNYNNYWVDDETMHKTMYYGSLLECVKRDKAKEEQKGLDYVIYSLGSDTVQVVKYVYRKAEKIEDDSTQSNLEQIKKSLDKIPGELKQ